MAKKTDNHNPKVKLDLRRYFLRKYHADEPPRVLDCCQGSGLLWRRLREEFAVASYWGLDLKPQKGRLKLDSVRVLAQPGWDQNVIDVDTYGAPWKHWLALLENVQLPATVFLTIGQNKMVGGFQGAPPRELVDALNLPSQLPPSIAAKLWDVGAKSLLAMGCVGRTMVAEAVEAVSDGNARYIGVRLEKCRTGGETPARRHPRAKKEPANV